jgi:hypothetical protein
LPLNKRFLTVATRRFGIMARLFFYLPQVISFAESPA